MLLKEAAECWVESQALRDHHQLLAAGGDQGCTPQSTCWDKGITDLSQNQSCSAWYCSCWPYSMNFSCFV